MDIPEEGLTREQIREMLAQLQQLQVDKTNLEIRVQNLAAEKETLWENTRNAQIRLEEQVLRSVPKFRDDGTVLFREHLSEIQKFIETRSHYLYTEKIKKTILWESLVGKAIQKVINNIEIKESFRNDDFEQFCGKVRQGFNPDSERGLVRSEFHAYQQTATQDVASYLTGKLSLYELAYDESERSYETLRAAAIKGLINLAVRRDVRRRNPKSEAALREAVVEAMAAECDAYHGG